LSRLELLVSRAFLFSKGVVQRMTLGARAILVEGDRVLLIRHGYISGWHFPGGGIEPGETAEESLRREVLEETGHRLTGPVDLKGVYLNTQATNRDHVLVYVCRAFEHVHERKPDREIAECRWFDRHDLPADVSPGTYRRIREIFENEPAASRW